MSIRRTSIHGVNLIKSFEGFSYTAYLDSSGVWTIGFGHTGDDVFQGRTVTAKEAVSLLKNDLHTVENFITWVGIADILNQAQFDALVSFAYNVGCGALGRSTLLKKVIKNPIDKTIRTEFMRWVYAGGKRLEGLKKRRKAEADMYFSVSEQPNKIIRHETKEKEII